MPTELGHLICIGGSAGAGKSVLAEALVNHFGVQRASFSDVLRLDAERLQVAPTRHNLQDLGMARIGAGWPQFVDAVVELIGWPPPRPSIIEGIRHPDAIRECKRQAGDLPALFVFLEADDIIRDQRLHSRHRHSGEPSRTLIDAHKVEREVSQLKDFADVVLSDGSVDSWLTEVVSVLGSPPARSP